MERSKAKKLLIKRKSALRQANNLLDPNFKIQTDFINHPSRFKALFATRRFGKSYTAGIYLLKEALENPGVSCLYIALTRDSAKGIMWKDVIKAINHKHKLKIKFNETLLTATLPNGSIIYLMGADSSEDDKSKILGRKFKIAVVDEAASFTINMRELVYGILKPAMADLNGTIVLIGTPSNIVQGLFFDITNDIEPGWHIVKGNTAENPYMKDKWAKEIAELKANQPYIIETPMFKQMYLGLWVIDTDKLVYRFDELKNVFIERPYPNSKGWTFNLSIDLGYEDDTAFIVGGYHENDPNFYIFKSFKKKHLTFDKVERKILEFQADPEFPISSIIVDGSNKQGVQSMTERSNIHFEYADRLGKETHIEICNGDLIQGKIKIHRTCTDLMDELRGLIWKTVGDKIAIPRKEHSACPNHLADAFLYNWYNGYHFLSTPSKVASMPGSVEYIKEQELLHKQAICERIQREQAQKDGSQTGWAKSKNGRDPWNEWD